MEEKKRMNEGEIVQLNPETVKNKMFAGCLMVVTEPKPWGVQGYVQSLGENGSHGGQAYYRAKFEEFEPITAEGVKASIEWLAK